MSIIRATTVAAALALAACGTPPTDLGPPQPVPPREVPWVSASTAFTIEAAERAQDDNLGVLRLTVRPTNGSGSALIDAQYLNGALSEPAPPGANSIRMITLSILLPGLSSWFEESGHRELIAAQGGRVTASEALSNGRETTFESRHGTTCVLVGRGVRLVSALSQPGSLAQVMRGVLCGDENIRRAFGDYVRRGLVTPTSPQFPLRR